MPRNIAIAFDGVLHQSKTPWEVASVIDGKLHPDAVPFLKSLVDDGRFKIYIMSSRLNAVDFDMEEGEDPHGALYQWLRRHLVGAYGQSEGVRILDYCQLCSITPPADVTIDAKAMTFVGTFPSLDPLAGYLPYDQMPVHLRADPDRLMAVSESLMMQIGKIAKDAGCPDGDAPLEFIRSRMTAGAPMPDAASKIATTDYKSIYDIPGGSLIEAEDRVRRHRMRVERIRRDNPGFSIDDAVAHHAAYVAVQTVETLRGISGLKAEVVGSATMVSDTDGTKLFAFDNDILPPDDPELAERIVINLYLANTLKVDRSSTSDMKVADRTEVRDRRILEDQFHTGYRVFLTGGYWHCLSQSDSFICCHIHQKEIPDDLTAAVRYVRGVYTAFTEGVRAGKKTQEHGQFGPMAPMGKMTATEVEEFLKSDLGNLLFYMKTGGEYAAGRWVVDGQPLLTAGEIRQREIEAGDLAALQSVDGAKS